MSNFFKHFSLRSIRIRFFLVFILISIVPIIIVTLISYNSYTTLVSRQISIISSNTLSNTVERLENMLQDINRISETFVFQQYASSTNSFINETSIASILKKYTHNEEISQYQLFYDWKNLKYPCQNLLYNYAYINMVTIFTTNGYTLSYSNGCDLQVDYKPFDDSWYRETLKAEGKLYVSDVEVKDFILNSKKSISFSRSLFDIDSHEFLGVLMIDCSLEIFKGLDKDIIPNVAIIYLIDKNGKIIFENTKTYIGQTLPEEFLKLSSETSEGSFNTKNGQYLTVFKSLQRNNWKVLAVISTHELNKQFDTTRNLIIYIAVTCSAVFILLSFLISSFLTRPIFELSAIMNRNKSLRLITDNKNLTRSDEIGILYNEYNLMINQINLFIRESYQNKLISLDSQMKALEAQINSHFLYNTLESINSIAEIEEVETIVIMSKALGDMFRYSIKTKSELVPVSEELTHVYNYLSIQRIRYEDKIHFVLNIQQDLYEMQILKLILQPIVENAIYHGLENKKGKGAIEIKGWCEGEVIFFDVADDGVGMSPEQLDEIQKLLAEPPEFSELGQRNKRSIGIKNVHSRIELYYGTGYGLSINSKQDLGTEVRIRIPVIKGGVRNV